MPMFRGREAEWMIAVAAVMIGIGGILLGIQLDADGHVAGTGFTPLAIGALLALVSLLARMGTSGGWPRDAIAALATASLFLGLAFVLAGVLAPGGPWMFCEVLVLLFAFARWRSRSPGARWISGGSLCLLGVMLLFRLWITYQGSEHRWQVASIGIPVLSWIPVQWLEPIQSVSLGSFTPHELGFPPNGIDFSTSMTLWALGFALCAGGLAIAQNAACEHENDRIHELIHTLPAPMASMVERLVPEEEWQSLGLHGMSERRQCKRIEKIVAERVRRQREIQSAFDASPMAALAGVHGFSGDIGQALGGATSEVTSGSTANSRSSDGGSVRSTHGSES
jgi:hypothetical protein